MNPFSSAFCPESLCDLQENSIDFPLPLEPEIARDVSAALAEDVGLGDLTASLIPEGRLGKATVIARESAVLCGKAWFDRCFTLLDPRVKMVWSAKDGDRIQPDQVLCEIEGNARALLTAERSGLNFLQLMSGVATKTRIYADTVAGTQAKIVDTRKTLPGLRIAQKYAVRVGGGANHRLALWDAILIKENHIMAAGSITLAMAEARKVALEAAGRCRFIQVEVENLSELEEALASGAEMVLLDNFSLELLQEAVAVNQRSGSKAILEASGGVSLEGLRAIAETGVDRISIGTLTKDVKALDLSMRFKVAAE
jgi:nicotinate-nucleotide pyrophosphorylase (carboxylating)